MKSVEDDAEDPAEDAPTAVTYDGLPLSSGSSHGLGAMPVRTAHERLRHFLEACTEPIAEPEYCFRLHAVPGLRHPRDLADEVARHFVDGHTRFPFPPEEADRAVTFLESVSPQQTNEYGMAPLWLWMVARVRLRDPDTGEVLPGQDPERYGNARGDGDVLLGTSRVQLTMDNRARVAVGFSFPDLDDEALRELVPRLQPHLPFTLSRRHWKRWTPMRNGRGYLGRRITL